MDHKSLSILNCRKAFLSREDLVLTLKQWTFICLYCSVWFTRQQILQELGSSQRCKKSPILIFLLFLNGAQQILFCLMMQNSVSPHIYSTYPCRWLSPLLWWHSTIFFVHSGHSWTTLYLNSQLRISHPISFKINFYELDLPYYVYQFLSLPYAYYIQGSYLSLYGISHMCL